MPERHNDELLGSWVSRIVLFNGLSAWRHSLITFGFPEDYHWTSKDFSYGIEQNDLLFQSLGASIESVQKYSTTLSFQVAFEMWDRRYLSHRLGKSRPFRKRLRGDRLWYCPTCLAEDCDRWGIGYWRRSHQVSVSLVCHIHEDLLVSRCRHCGFSPAVIQKTLLDLPSAQCRCGANLREPISWSFDRQTELVALARLAASSMNNAKAITWDPHQVKDLVQQQFEPRKFKFGVMRLLSEHYGLEIKNGSLELVIGEKFHKSHLSCSTIVSNFRASSVAMLVSALGWSYAEFEARVMRQSSQSKTSERMDRRLSNRRERLLQSMRRSISIHGSLDNLIETSKEFWKAALTDFDWLVRTGFVEPGNINGVSVENDRGVLSFVLSDSEESQCASWKVAKYRASIRDKDWLNRRLRSNKVEQGSLGNLSSEHRLKELREALAHCVGRQILPARVSRTELAGVLGISFSEVDKRIEMEPVFKLELDSHNVGYRKMLVKAKLQELAAEQRQTSLSNFLRKITDGNYRSMKIIVEQLLAENPDWQQWINQRHRPGRPKRETD